jgi:glutaminyl-peptide cyclotransferase
MLYPEVQRNTDADVFNGISVSEDPEILYVTGKRWDRMFKIKLL